MSSDGQCAQDSDPVILCPRTTDTRAQAAMSLAARCLAYLVAIVLLIVTPFTWMCLPAWGPALLNRVRRDLIRSKRWTS